VDTTLLIILLSGLFILTVGIGVINITFIDNLRVRVKRIEKHLNIR